MILCTVCCNCKKTFDKVIIIIIILIILIILIIVIFIIIIIYSSFLVIGVIFIDLSGIYCWDCHFIFYLFTSFQKKQSTHI